MLSIFLDTTKGIIIVIIIIIIIIVANTDKRVQCVDGLARLSRKDLSDLQQASIKMCVII